MCSNNFNDIKGTKNSNTHGINVKHFGRGAMSVGRGAMSVGH